MRFKSIYAVFSAIFILLILIRSIDVFAQTPTDTPTPTPTPTPDNSQAASDLQKQISEYEKKISDLKGQEKTLSSQISVMDSQIKLTELRIAAAKEQIKQLKADIEIAKGKVDNLQRNIDASTKTLIARISAVYQVGRIAPWEIFLAANNINDVFKRLTYLRIVQVYDKQKVYAAEQAKNDYSNQKEIYETKEAEAQALNKKLESYTDQLAQEKKGKQTLLSETQGSETNYQRLLSQAKAQLAGFQRFVTSQGGASILSNQTVCDDWGCYYNQRDSQWGNNALNGTQYTLASDGCLVTAMAMVYTHLGKRGVTPQTINSNSSNFASYYPAYLNKTISADGMTTSRIYGTIDAELSTGKPVIIGIGRGPDHFVVFISGSNGDYTMHDPFVPSGHHIKFTDHYSISSINSIERISY